MTTSLTPPDAVGRLALAMHEVHVCEDCVLPTAYSIAAESVLAADPALAEDLALGALLREVLVKERRVEIDYSVRPAGRPGGPWWASSEDQIDARDTMLADGSTPAEALQALTEKLRNLR